ncbi:mitochondrial small ribosomal subunit Rsm22-domain-containing protein, partial [Trichophaea hybrida]
TEEESIESYIRTVRDEWGNNLPEGLLSPEEYVAYERYYGPPIRILNSEEIEEMEKELMGKDTLESEDRTVTLEDVHGVEIENELEEVEPVEEAELVGETKPVKEAESMVGEELEETRNGEFQARSAKEAAMYARIADDIRRSLALAEQGGDQAGEIDTIDEFDEDTEEPFLRTHPLTQLGQSGTHPATIITPDSVTLPTTEFLSEVSNRHLDEAAHKIFGGPVLPNSPIVTGKSDKRFNGMPLDTSDGMSDMESNVHLAMVLPGYYAQTLSALTELRRRLGGDWILGREGGTEPGVKQVLDVGTGGAGILAWRAMIKAERELRDEEAAEREDIKPTFTDTKPVEGEEEATSTGLKAVVVVGSSSLRFRMSKFLKNTNFISHLPDALADTKPPIFKDESSPETTPKQPRKLYDLIISTNTILTIHEDHKRKSHVQNLWSLLNPKGGVLLLIEKGTPQGFEAIAGARQSLLKHNISTPDSQFIPLTEYDDISTPRSPKEIASIVAPCTNHQECPMFISGPKKSARRDYCSFIQRYERPGYMQRVLKAKARNHEDLQYSYVAVRRGIDVTKQETPVITPKIEDFDTSVVPPKSPYSMPQLRTYAYTLPRAVFPPIKRQGHVILDLCTSMGKIERWTVPKSYGKIPYRDARKSRWGDLWALGAKTQIPRNLQLGDKKSKAEKK